MEPIQVLPARTSCVSVREDIVPHWFKPFFKVCSGTFLITVLYVAALFGVSLVPQAETFIAFFSGSLASPIDFLATDVGLASLAGVVLLACILYAIGLVRMRRWSIPILLFVATGLGLIGILGLLHADYHNPWEIIGRITGPGLVILVGSSAWVYRWSFVGQMRKLWIQIPLLVVLGPVIGFSVLAQIYTDDPAVNDTDLVLVPSGAVQESENAYYQLPDVDNLSFAEQSSFEKINEFYTILERGGAIDVSAASAPLAVLNDIMSAFDTASQESAYQCPTLVGTYGLDAVPCPLTGLRSTAQAFAVRAYVESWEGDTNAALRDSRVPMRLAHLIDAGQPTSVEHLTSIALMEVGLHSMNRVLDTATVSDSKALQVSDELTNLEFDGSALATSLKREYRSMKETLQGFGVAESYLWHRNSTINHLATLMRERVRVAQAVCGGDLLKEELASDPQTANEETPAWWTLLTPNGIGELFKSTVGDTLSGAREQECELNVLNAHIRDRLLGKD